MSFIDKVIHTLCNRNDTLYVENWLESVKEHIRVLINSKDDDFGLLSLGDLDISAKNLAVTISERLYYVISMYEHRIKILSIEYDEALAPWNLSFFIRFCYSGDSFKEYSMQINFRNNRYCEII